MFFLANRPIFHRIGIGKGIFKPPVKIKQSIKQVLARLLKCTTVKFPKLGRMLLVLSL